MTAIWPAFDHDLSRPQLDLHVQSIQQQTKLIQIAITNSDGIHLQSILQQIEPNGYNKSYGISQQLPYIHVRQQ